MYTGICRSDHMPENAIAISSNELDPESELEDLKEQIRVGEVHLSPIGIGKC
jgi:hypothetical protein